MIYNKISENNKLIDEKDKEITFAKNLIQNYYNFKIKKISLSEFIDYYKILLKK